MSEALQQLARQLGWPADDAETYARIAAGAANAVAAVSSASRDSLFDIEPGNFLSTLEQLAEEQLADRPTQPEHGDAADAARPAPRPAPKDAAAAGSVRSEPTLCELVDALAAGQLSAQAHVRERLARLETLAPPLNCVLRVHRERALTAAAAADEAWRRGEPPGVLHGVALAHKDMFYRRGEVLSCGSLIRANWQAPVTATVLERLDAAGALDIAALHMAEFALGPTGHNAHYGPCRNPWNPAYISGGSSSGSAVAVAAGLVPASLGSDTGGSVRLPAAICGVVGIKPTWGRVSRYGLMGLSQSVDVAGVFARNARDCARVLGVIAGDDGRDPHLAPRPVPAFEAACFQGIEGLRIGVPQNYFDRHLTDEVAALMEASLGALEALGARLVPVTLPDPEPLTELGRTVIYAEATARHAHWLQHHWEGYSPQVRARAATGLAIPAMSYVQALQLRPRLLRRFVAEVFDSCDVLHAPTLAIPVPTIEETDVGAGAAMWEIIAKLVHCTGPVNYLGLPALSVPAGFTRNGLPAGFQLIGRPFAEATLLRTGAAYETVTDWSRCTPGQQRAAR
ncbi:MAG: amidase [Gammaproteobacteria bacterium]|nr:amidase [Gammaproteobacteria bacterium]